MPLGQQREAQPVVGMAVAGVQLHRTSEGRLGFLRPLGLDQRAAEVRPCVVQQRMGRDERTVLVDRVLGTDAMQSQQRRDQSGLQVRIVRVMAQPFPVDGERLLVLPSTVVHAAEQNPHVQRARLPLQGRAGQTLVRPPVQIAPDAHPAEGSRDDEHGGDREPGSDFGSRSLSRYPIESISR